VAARVFEAQAAPPSKLGAWLRLGRPQFWAIFCVGMHVTGVLLAGTGVRAGRFIAGQVFIWAVNAMTLYANEYFDLAADRANATPTRWTGGSRVLVRGVLAPSVALYTALALGAFALGWLGVLAVVVTPEATGLMLLCGAICALLAWSYVGPPLRLHYRGLGELTATLIIIVLVPLLGALAQSGRLQLEIVPVLAPLALAHIARMLVMNIPDREGDAAVGKRTLVVLLGGERAVRLHNLLLLLAHALQLALLALGLAPRAALLMLLVVPLSVAQARALARGEWRDPAAFSALATRATIHLNLTALALLAGAAWGSV
jgi:1,4-dihydroxy-2-naphthoate octaprenyltransferase